MSWKTTTCAIAGIIVAAWTMIGSPILDNDPATVAHFPEFISLAVASLSGLFARDNDKTSEQVGAAK